MAFESLSDKLQNIFKNLRGKGRLTEADVKTALKEVKLALLEADVSFKVVKQFIKAVQERAIGQDVMNGLNPGQMVIKIVNDELVNLMGSETTVSSSASVDISKEDSDAVHVDANLEKPVFSVNPVESLQIPVGNTSGKLTCEAGITGEGTVTYQWYKNNVNSNGGGTPIEGATEVTYQVDTSAEGKDYYYVVATNTVGNTVSMATSTVTEVTVIPAGKWVQNENGWQYQNNDGSYATNTWQNIDGYWYVFDENSYMVTGWYWSGEEWYYLADNGQMQTGWFTQDGEEYYLDPDTGVMARNTTIDGHEMNSSGVKVS